MTNLQKPTWYACYTEGLNSDVSFVRTYEEAVALVDWNISDDPSLSFDNLVTPLYLHPPQPQATTPSIRQHCSECANWAKAVADTKEWADGVKIGREIIKKLASTQGEVK